MGTGWKVLATLSTVAFAIALGILFVTGASAQVIELTDEHVYGYAFDPEEGLVLVGTEEGLEAFRLDGSWA